MSFNYKNPISPLSVLGNTSVSRSDIFGTNFSVLNTGGYMEVYSLSDLIFTIPSGTTGLVEFSGNTIPIQLNIGTGSAFSPNVLTLNSDNISSGRRRIGMLVYVINENQIYQYQIPNYEVLWNSATGSTGPGGNTVIFSDFGTTIKGNTTQGINFISSWTGNTIEGISGGTRSNSNWIKYYGTDLAITGGTFSNVTNILTLTNITGGTIPITGFTSFDRAISAFTYDNANTFIIDDNSGNTYSATINLMTGLTINGDLNVTGTTTSNLFSGVTFSGGTYYGDGSNLSGINDYFTTGATFDALTKIGTFTRNDGNTYTLNLSSLTTVDTYVTGFTSSGTNLTILQNEGQSPISTTIPTVSLSGALSSVTFNIVTTGNIQSNGLTATTISATTYQNLPTDIRVTGATYNNNTFTYTNNTGGTFNVLFNTMSGLTINGGLTVSGNSQLNGGISSTSFTGNTDRIVQVNSGGTFTAVTDIISAYISSGSTAAVLLSNVSNWDINGNYIGIPISGTYQGQKWYDNNYFYEAVQDNLFIRLIRG